MQINVMKSVYEDTSVVMLSLGDADGQESRL